MRLPHSRVACGRQRVPHDVQHPPTLAFDCWPLPTNVNMAPRARTILALAVGMMLGLSLSVTDRVMADRAMERAGDDLPSSSRNPDGAGLPWKDAKLLAVPKLIA